MVVFKTDDIANALQEGLARHQVPGISIAVTHRGEVSSVSAGVTNVTTGVPLTPQTVMHLGSITKVFNTTLVMQMVDDGLIQLDQPVAAYLPDLRLKEAEALDSLTVKMLLNHTSGIDGTGVSDQGREQETIEAGVQRLANSRQLFSPGTDYSYSNPGMMIAGYLAQRLRGKGWYRLVREGIFERLGLQFAATLPEEAILYRSAVGHILDGNLKPTRTTRAFGPFSRAPSGTTLMMSATDLITFAQAHMALGLAPNGLRLLSDASAIAMQACTVDNSQRHYAYMNVGLGWMVSNDGLLCHTGGGPGIVSALYVWPKHGFAVAALSNAEYGLGLINELIGPWLDKLGSAKPMGEIGDFNVIKPELLNVDAYLGTYEDAGIRFCVSRLRDGIGLSRQPKITNSDSESLATGPVQRIEALGKSDFVLTAKGDYRVPEMSRLFVFRNPERDGRMQHLGNMERLYRRTV